MKPENYKEKSNTKEVLELLEILGIDIREWLDE